VLRVREESGNNGKVTRLRFRHHDRNEELITLHTSLKGWVQKNKYQYHTEQRKHNLT